jgi:hypothetical protein
MNHLQINSNGGSVLIFLQLDGSLADLMTVNGLTLFSLDIKICKSVGQNIS